MPNKREYIDPFTESLLSTLSHEVLAKIQAIKSYATLILDLSEDLVQKDVGPSQRKWLEAILAEVDNIPPVMKDASRIIQALRDTSERNEHPVLVNLESALKGTVSVFSASMSHCQLHLEIDTGPFPSIMCNFNEELLRRSLELIIGNLVALTPKKAELQINLSTREKRILITICGEGVTRLTNLSPAEATQTLLEGAPSIRTGMDVARKIVRSYGGEVQLNDSRDCLNVDLPFVSFTTSIVNTDK